MSSSNAQPLELMNALVGVHLYGAYAIHAGYKDLPAGFILGTEWSRRRWLTQYIVDRAAVDQGKAPRVERAKRRRPKKDSQASLIH